MMKVVVPSLVLVLSLVLHVLRSPVSAQTCSGCFPLGSFPAEYQTCGGNRYAGLPFATRSPVMAQHGVAATSQPLATNVALDVMKRGGNAIDAAIAANAVLGLMEPTGCGIGGDLFAIVWDPVSSRLHGLNGSGRSPSNLTHPALLARLAEVNSPASIPPYGPLPISVPGCVDAWFSLHSRFGKLPMADVLQPAVDYAREGFPVSQVIAAAWANAVARYRQQDAVDFITTRGKYPQAFRGFEETFLVNGEAPKAGELFRNPVLASTLERLQRGGRDEFYSGSIADEIDAFARTVGLELRKADLQSHRSEWVEPLSTTYRGVAVHELPPNGQGLAALQMLNILEGFDLASMGHNSPDYLHVMTEAKKLAYADRAMYYADPAFATIPTETLLSKEYAAERRQLIDMERAAAHVDAGQIRQGDTIYMTVADGDGLMVSLIQSNYRGMGSGVVAPGLGFAFQDRGEMFNLNQTHANAYAPGKRPFHTIIPAFATKDGKPFMSFGVMGGDMQPQGHVQIIVNMVDFGMNVQEAGDAARFRHTGDTEPTGYVMQDGGLLYLERGVCSATRQALEARGHAVRGGDDYGGYQAIMLNQTTGVYHAASEMRKDGHAAGY